MVSPAIDLILRTKFGGSCLLWRGENSPGAKIIDEETEYNSYHSALAIAWKDFLWLRWYMALGSNGSGFFNI